MLQAVEGEAERWMGEWSRYCHHAEFSSSNIQQLLVLTRMFSMETKNLADSWNSTALILHMEKPGPQRTQDWSNSRWQVI